MDYSYIDDRIRAASAGSKMLGESAQWMDEILQELDNATANQSDATSLLIHNSATLARCIRETTEELRSRMTLLKTQIGGETKK